MSSHLTVSQLAHILWRRKWRVGFGVVVGGVAAIAFCAMAVPRFDASTTLLINPGRQTHSSSSVEAMAQVARHDQVVRSQVGILESEDVIQDAVARVGGNKLYPRPEGSGWKAQAAEIVRWATPESMKPWISWEQVTRTPEKNESGWYAQARKALKVTVQPNTDLIVITFRHHDKELAAQVANELVKSYIDKLLSLSRAAGTASFFISQRQAHWLRFEEASLALSNFVRERRMFAVDEQRRLALSRRSELLSALANGRSAAAEKQSQVISISRQLALMKPVSQLPQLAHLPNSPAVRAQIDRAAKNTPNTGEPKDNTTQILTKDPPLLLVRVYQETVQSLVKFNAELAGLRALEENQKSELQSIEEELLQLARAEGEYERLRLSVLQAKESVEAYSKRAASEQVDDDMSAAGLTNVQVAQWASVPAEPAFPKVSLVLVLGLFAGGVLGLSSALLAGSRSSAAAPQVPAVAPTDNTITSLPPFRQTSRA